MRAVSWSPASVQGSSTRTAADQNFGVCLKQRTPKNYEVSAHRPGGPDFGRTGRELRLGGPVCGRGPCAGPTVAHCPVWGLHRASLGHE
eukprot:357274-Chlamydomonas_euryale.AAC.17